MNFKFFSPARLAACLLVLFSVIPGTAQDGIIFSAKPPITVRYAINDLKVYLTNTSDKILHAVTVNNVWSDGKTVSKVIVDTIEPHKTVAVEWRVELVEGTLTCDKYSKPLPFQYSP